MKSAGWRVVNHIIVQVFRLASETNRQELNANATSTARKTWASQGLDPSASAKVTG
jgi:hypothetical protein